MQSSHAISRLEFHDFFAYFMDSARDIITLVD
jgi:hypothetical protein